MKTIILAGGFGTRLSELTELIPKPMVPIGGRPIIWHIMDRYAKFGYKDFYLALGYKAELFKEFFLHYKTLNSDFSINLGDGEIKIFQQNAVDWRVNLIDTGLNSMTGGRVKRLMSHIGSEPFLLTYGDGLANIDIDKLVKFHKDHGKLVTVTAVRPGARFGELKIDPNSGQVDAFKEKPQITDGWINGGYFVIEPEFFDLLDKDATSLEKEPLEKLALQGQLVAYKHEGFWQCMDTKRDHELLESMWSSGNPPWI